MMDINTLRKGLRSAAPLRTLYEQELIRLMTENDRDTVRFFYSEYSRPFLSFIAMNICRVASCYEILSDYYEFVAKPDNPLTGKDSYLKLRQFKSKNDSTLYWYLSLITVRYFVSEQKKIAKQLQTMMDYHQDILLLMCVSTEDEDDWSAIKRRVNSAFEKLPERDRKILQYMVVGNESGLDVFEEMLEYINPRCGRDNARLWTDKMKQSAMSLLKCRALDHLKILYKNER